MSQLTEDRCRFCGATVPPGEPVCPECGRVPLSPMGRCQKCGAHLYPGDAFCPKCGTRSKPQKESGNPNIDAFNQKQRKKKTAKRLCLGISIGICVLAVAVALTIFWILPYITYQRAMDALASGDYAQAYTLFLSLDGYQDSEVMINETRYQEAQSIFDSGSFGQAKKIFLELGTYRNSEDMALECDYQVACDWLSRNSYENAYPIFKELGDYKDSNDQELNCIILWMTKIMSQEKPPSAYRFLDTITLTPDQYEMYYKTLLLMITEYDSFEYWRFSITAAKNMHGMLSLLPQDYEDTALLTQLFQLIDSASYRSIFQKNSAVLRKCWGLGLVQDMVAHDYVIKYFLEGHWSGNGYYMDFYEDSGRISSRFDLPSVSSPASSKYYSIKDRCFVYTDGKNTLAQVFRFEIVDYNTIRVYCYQNGRTYTLYR